MSLQFLGLAGSLRAKSTNRGLLRAAQGQLPAGVSLVLAELADVPFYNADLTEKPAAVQRVLAQLAAADALVLACPEYNYSLAPALKNMLDWASREPDTALRLFGKPEVNGQRRMGVALARDESIEAARAKATRSSKAVVVEL